MDISRITVAVLFGGRSVEHDVSIITAQQIIAALDNDKYQALPVYIDKEGHWYSNDHMNNVAAFKNMPKLLKRSERVGLCLEHGVCELRSLKTGRFSSHWNRHIDVAIPAGHGAFMEDGCLQGVLELAGIPYVGPGPLAAAVSMDKILQKAALRAAGLPVVDHYAFTAPEWRADKHLMAAQAEQALGLSYPMIVKPADLGSSIGVCRVTDRDSLYNAVEAALLYSRRVLVEQAIEPHRDICCAVLGGAEGMELSLCEEPLSAAEILSFEDKYLGAAKNRPGAPPRLPADLDNATEQQIRRYAVEAFRAVDGRGVCRIDFLLDERNKVFVNELNAIPGSLAFYLFEPLGISFASLLQRLIEQALAEHEEKGKLLRSYPSDILSAGQGKGENARK